MVKNTDLRGHALMSNYSPYSLNPRSSRAQDYKLINNFMKRNNKKKNRVVSVAQSLGFCREVMIKMRAMGYDMVAVTSPGHELEELRDKDEFSISENNESLLLNCRAKKMYEIVNKQVKFLTSQYIGTC